jgi:hypothetical protein
MIKLGLNCTDEANFLENGAEPKKEKGYWYGYESCNSLA